MAKPKSKKKAENNAAEPATEQQGLQDQQPQRPAWASTDQLMKDYYDHEWGLAVTDERALFEALSLEAFQSGLSWATILRKRQAFRKAFANFDPDVVAEFTDKDVQRLMQDEGIVRNLMKINATIRNAAATVQLRKEGGLAALVWSFAPAEDTFDAAEQPSRTPESEALAKALRKRGFNFVGPTTMYAFMQAIGVVRVKP